MIGYRKATEGDALHIGRNLKDDDKEELEALFSGPLPDIIRSAVITADQCYAIGPEGAPFCIFGVQADGPVGYIWALCTPEVYDHWRPMHRAVSSILDDLGQTFDLLANIKDARQHRHIRWLRSLGFTFINTQPMGPQGLPFHQFVRIQK